MNGSSLPVNGVGRVGITGLRFVKCEYFCDKSNNLSLNFAKTLVVRSQSSAQRMGMSSMLMLQ